MKKKREYAFDILRIIAMFMVIIVHVSNVYSRGYGLIGMHDFLASLIYNTISRISVPIFLMISGALLLDRKFEKKKYIQRIIRFLILIIVWDIIYLVWEYFYLGIQYDQLYRLVLEPYRAHLWFLYTIITLYLLQPLMKWLLDKMPNALKWILLVLWIILSSYSLINPWIAKNFTLFSYIGYFIVGKYLYEWIKKNITKKYNLLGIGIIVVCITISVLLNYYSSRKYGFFYNWYFAYRTIFIMLSSFSLFALVITNYQKEKISKITSALSEVSLGVYLIHGMFLDIVVKEFPLYDIKTVYAIPIYSIFIFVLSVLSVYLLRKIKILQTIF